mgnify:CR=1 FL=1|tara:strand:- start:7 stop:363 length:357 start_codon:yes stop_codon:yes gene_type:complete
MDGWIDLSFHPILDVIASIIYGLFRDQAAIFFEHIAACLSVFLLLSIYITQQTKRGFIMVYVYMFFCTLNMVAGVTLMFASLGTFNLPPMHHYINVFMFVMGLVLAAHGYISAWRHKC